MVDEELPSPVALEADVQWQCASFSLRARLRLGRRITGVLGASGSGKSTLLNVVAGLCPRAQGRVVVGGHVVLDSTAGIDVPAHQRRIGYVFQQGRLMPHLSVWDNLVYGYRLLPAAHRRLHPDKVVSLLELEPLLGRRSNGLSGGERQRVAIGRALLTSPRLLLLDEPLAAVDSGHKREVLPYLRQIHSDLAIPMIYVTHAIAEVLTLTDQVALMDAGQVVGQGDLFTVLCDDRAFAVADALGLDNVVEVDIGDTDGAAGVTTAFLSGQSISLPAGMFEPGTRVALAVRPEDIIVATEAVGQMSAQNALRGTIQELSVVRGRVMVRVDVGQPLRVEVTRRAVTQLQLRPGCGVICLAKTFAFRPALDRPS